MQNPPTPQKEKRSNISAGLLMFRRRNNSLEFLLVHPGGPFWKNKDEGAWSLPKGEIQPNEDLLTRAQIEFEEEIGCKPQGDDWIPLGSIKQKNGKIVHAWGFEGDLPDPFELKSNTFELEWPPRSGKFAEIPEVDRAEFFSEEVAKEKINPGQIPFLERLRAALTSSGSTTNGH